MKEQTFSNAFHESVKQLSQCKILTNVIDIVAHWANGKACGAGDKLFDSDRYYDQQKILYPGKVELLYLNND